MNHYYYIIIVTIYVAVLFLISYLARTKAKSHEDYIISGRKVSSFNAALSAGASDMSGWLLLGLPGAVYLLGINQLWMAIGLTIGAWLNWLIIAPRLRKYSEKCKTATVPDFFAEYVGRNFSIIRIVAGLMILIFFTVYVSSGFVAGAKVFSNYFNIPYHYALYLTAAIIVGYVSIGGLLAINWTDVINGILIIVVMSILPVAIFITLKLQGIPILDTITSSNSNAFNIIYNTSWLQIISLLAWGLGYFGQPHIVNQFMAIKSAEATVKARRIGITWMALGLGFAIIIGLLGTAFFASNPLSDPEAVMIALSTQLTPIFTGFVLVALLAVIMSTASVQLLIISTVFTNDFRVIKKRIITNKLLIVIVATFSVIIAYNPNSKVLSMVSYAWAGFGACFGPLMLISLLCKSKVNSYGALSGIIIGGLVVILWNYLRTLDIAIVFQLYEILPGFIFSALTIFIVSYFTKNIKIAS